MKGIVWMLGILLIGTLLFSCAPKPAVEPVAPEAPKPVEITKEAWEIEWDKTIGEAKKEGKVILYAEIGPDMRTAFGASVKEYKLVPEILVGRGRELAEKILRERRAGIYTVDFVLSGLDTFVAVLKPEGILAPLKPLLVLPEVKDPKLWHKGELPFADKEKERILAFEAYLDHGIHINTEIIKPGDINSMRDLLAPVWKNKIIMDDPTVAGRGRAWMTVVAIRMGEDYVKELAKQKPLLTRDMKLMMDWIAKGRYPVGIGARPDQYQEYKRAGAPVTNLVLNEVAYLLSGVANVIYMDKAPNPNASKIFLNWLLSKKGQTIWQQIRGTQSARIDTPVEQLREAGQPIRQLEGDYYESSSEHVRLEVWPRFYPLLIEIFTPLVK